MSKSSVLDTTVKTYLLDCINSDDMDLATVADKINYSRIDFYSSQAWNVERIGEQSAVKEWLQGLPSSINIAFANYEILQIAVKWQSLPADYSERQADKILENWFNLLAAKLCQLWRGYRVPK
jgi:hypothetical protein